MTSKGYIKIWRKIWDDPLFDSRRVFSKFEAWVDLIMLAIGIDKEIDFLGDTIDLKRGQLATSQSRLAKRWGWSRWRVDKYLKLLSSKNVQKLSIKLYHKTTVITILNYNKYNPLPAAEQQQIKQQNNSRTTGINKRLNNNINKKEEEYGPAHLRIKFNFKEKRWQGIIKEDLEDWKKSFPDVDIEYHLYKKMINWILNNPRKGRKKNYGRFINNWLSSEQETFDLKKAKKLDEDKRTKDWLKKED